MKGSKHPKNDITINPSGNESIRDVISRVDISRRDFVKSTVAISLATAVGVALSPKTAYAAAIPASNGFAGIGFDSIPAKLAPVANSVEVPAGYTVEVLTTWGQPIMPGAPDWNPDATQDAAVQMMQFGMHNDGMHYFPFATRTGPSSVRGIMAINNEYTHEEILHGAEGLTGGAGVTIAKVRKSQAGHGVSIIEARKNALGKWSVVRSSVYGRRITANTPMKVSGPAAGHALLKSKKFDIQPTGSTEIGLNDGYTAYGTHNNCAHGYTPWGTYLTCEENWNGNFGWNASDPAPTDPAVTNNITRYGLSTAGFGYNWHVADPRFNACTNPLEPHLYGWVVEVDPMDPNSVPVKRTALGRFKHEGAQLALSYDAYGVANRLAYYMGDDERNEYIYKFVCADPFNPTHRAANLNLLDSGTLYVARFTSTPGATAGSYRGEWIALLPDTLSVVSNGAGGFYKLRELGHFNGTGVNGASNPNDAEVQALILIKTRQAADAVGATMMDRPEWTAVRTYDGYGNQNYDAQRPLEIYCTLTNNSRRGNTPVSSNSPAGTTGAATANPPVDLANPRPDNDFGHIIRWREDGNYVTATGFEWDIFTLCGDTATTKTLAGTYTNTNLVGGVAGTGPFYQGDIVDNPAGSADFGAPDGLWFDQFGRLWVQTDQAGDAAGDFVNVGANVMCCADPNTKEMRRFLTSPPNCEVTGVVNTPDGKTMFIGIQHPGEGGTPANPTLYSNWPQSQFDKNSAGEYLAVVAGTPQPVGAAIRPRSSVLVITRNDGGVIGA